MIICLDFDDTLCGHDERPLPGVESALRALTAAGCELVVSSARFSPIYGELNVFRQRKVASWLDDHGVLAGRVSLVVPEADLYVDDKGYRFSGSWEVELPRILKELQGKDTVSLDLGAVLGVPRSTSAVKELEDAGITVHFSMAVSNSQEILSAKQRLRAEGFENVSLHAEKKSADLYVNPKAYPFKGDWSLALYEIMDLIGSSLKR